MWHLKYIYFPGSLFFVQIFTNFINESKKKKNEMSGLSNNRFSQGNK